ncbi:MAG: RsmD family RNA methyltransferase [Bacteroidaceae bacterium]|nr:RsmD family RNA methyltransferase [Bacteroidaceae bacterium]
MRVVAGKYRGRHFDVPRTFKARPTTDFAKENLFNVLRSYIDFEAEEPRALDLFAGTGSITLELLSRGCSHVTSLEFDPQHCSFIRSFLKALDAESQVTLLRADVLRFLRKSGESFDFIFADPPYALPELESLPDLIFRDETLSESSEQASGVRHTSSLLVPGGLFVLEHGRSQDFSSHPHFIGHRAYGSVNFSFFR